MRKVFFSFVVIHMIFTGLVVTVNAQMSWTVVNFSSNVGLHDIEFTDDRTGFVSTYGTGTVYKTTNGGKSWDVCLQTDSIYFEQIQFINKNTGWICGEKGKIFKTTDAGKKWIDQSIISEGNLLLYGLYFMNDSIGFVSGALLQDGRTSPRFYETKNGGLTWKITLNDFPVQILSISEFQNQLFGSGKDFIAIVEPMGNKWKYVFNDSLSTTGQIRDLKFSNQHTGIAVSFNGRILLTDDGGNSFSVKSITDNRLRSVIYLGNNKWIAVGDENKTSGKTLYYSYDNGNTWRHDNSFKDIHRIVKAEGKIWIAGKNGLIAFLELP